MRCLHRWRAVCSPRVAQVARRRSKLKERRNPISSPRSRACTSTRSTCQQRRPQQDTSMMIFLHRLPRTGTSETELFSMSRIRSTGHFALVKRMLALFADARRSSDVALGFSRFPSCSSSRSGRNWPPSFDESKSRGMMQRHLL
jgi:hypothetical protein